MSYVVTRKKIVINDDSDNRAIVYRSTGNQREMLKALHSSRKILAVTYDPNVEKKAPKYAWIEDR
jgi:hypothetical protein